MLIAKRPKTAIFTLVATILIAAIAVGCTFTGARKETKLASPELAQSFLRDSKKYAFTVLTYVLHGQEREYTLNYQPVYLGDDQRPTLDYAELIERSLNGMDLTDYVECEARADENAGADQFLLFMAEDWCRVSVFSEVDEKTMIPAETMLITFEFSDGSVCNFEGPGNNDLLSVPGLVSNIRGYSRSALDRELTGTVLPDGEPQMLLRYAGRFLQNVLETTQTYGEVLDSEPDMADFDYRFTIADGGTYLIDRDNMRFLTPDNRLYPLEVPEGRPTDISAILIEAFIYDALQMEY